MKAIIVLFFTILVAMATMEEVKAWDFQYPVWVYNVEVSNTDLFSDALSMIFSEYDEFARILAAEQAKEVTADSKDSFFETANILIGVFRQVLQESQFFLQSRIHLPNGLNSVHLNPNSVHGTFQVKIQQWIRWIAQQTNQMMTRKRRFQEKSTPDILQLILEKRFERQMVYDEVIGIRVDFEDFLAKSGLKIHVESGSSPDAARQTIDSAVAAKQKIFKKVEETVLQEVTAGKFPKFAEVGEAALRHQIRERLFKLPRAQFKGTAAETFLRWQERRQRRDEEQNAAQESRNWNYNALEVGFYHGMLHNTVVACDAADDVARTLEEVEGLEPEEVKEIVVKVEGMKKTLLQEIQQHWSTVRTDRPTYMYTKSLLERKFRDIVLQATQKSRNAKTIAKEIAKHEGRLKVRQEARRLEIEAVQFAEDAKEVEQFLEVVHKATKAEIAKIAQMENVEKRFYHAAVRLDLRRLVLQGIPAAGRFSYFLQENVAVEEKKNEEQDNRLRQMFRAEFRAYAGRAGQRRLAELGLDDEPLLYKIEKRIVYELQLDLQDGFNPHFIREKLRERFENEIAALEVQPPPHALTALAKARDGPDQMARSIWVAAGLSSVALLSIAAIMTIFWTLKKQRKAGQKEASLLDDRNLGGIESRKHFVW